MQFTVQESGGVKYALVEDQSEVMVTAQDALDLAAEALYQACECALIPKAKINEAFFDLRTGLAGEILQKFTNFRFRVAIIGDFGGYASKALQDFIYESNNRGKVLFVPTAEEALAIFAKSR